MGYAPNAHTWVRAQIVTPAPGRLNHAEHQPKAGIETLGSVGKQRRTME